MEKVWFIEKGYYGEQFELHYDVEGVFTTEDKARKFLKTQTDGQWFDHAVWFRMRPVNLNSKVGWNWKEIHLYSVDGKSLEKEPSAP